MNCYALYYRISLLRGLLLLALFICLACANSLQAQSESDYFPMHIGNKWTYEYHWEDRNHNTLDSVITLSVVDSISKYYRFDRYFLYYNIFWGDSSLFKIKDKKVIRKVNGKDMAWYNFTANTGESWTIPVNDYKIFSPETLDVVAVLKSKTDVFILDHDTLKNCYRFQFRFSKWIPDVSPWEELFAPDIGLVEKTAGSKYWIWESYKLKKAIINDVRVSIDVEQDHHQNVPSVFFLTQNYPNPFQSRTRISYRVIAPSAVKVAVKIYNVTGQEIKTLIDGFQPPGLSYLTWDGKNNIGQDVSNGIYLCVLTTSDYHEMKKIILAK